MPCPDNRAVSPVVAIALLIAVTVAMASGAAVFFTSFGTENPAPVVATDAYITTNGTVYIAHTDGAKVDTASLRIIVGVNNERGSISGFPLANQDLNDTHTSGAIEFDKQPGAAGEILTDPNWKVGGVLKFSLNESFNTSADAHITVVDTSVNKPIVRKSVPVVPPATKSATPLKTAVQSKWESWHLVEENPNASTLRVDRLRVGADSGTDDGFTTMTPWADYWGTPLNVTFDAGPQSASASASATLEVWACDEYTEPGTSGRGQNAVCEQKYKVQKQDGDGWTDNPKTLTFTPNTSVANDKLLYANLTTSCTPTTTCSVQGDSPVFTDQTGRPHLGAPVDISVDGVANTTLTVDLRGRNSTTARWKMHGFVAPTSRQGGGSKSVTVFTAPAAGDYTIQVPYYLASYQDGQSFPANASISVTAGGEQVYQDSVDACRGCGAKTRTKTTAISTHLDTGESVTVTVSVDGVGGDAETYSGYWVQKQAKGSGTVTVRLDPATLNRTNTTTGELSPGEVTELALEEVPPGDHTLYIDPAGGHEVDANVTWQETYASS